MALAVFDGSLDQSGQLVFDLADGSVAVLEAISGGLAVFDQDEEVEAGDVGEVGADPVVVDQAEAECTCVGEVPPGTVPVVDDSVGTDVVVIDEDGVELVVITEDGPPGPIGPQGGSGEQGPQGIPGADGAGSYQAMFYFAIPSTEWLITHNQNQRGLNVDLLDSDGTPLVGHTQAISDNEILVSWYFPMVGSARVFR